MKRRIREGGDVDQRSISSFCSCGCGESITPAKKNASGIYYVNAKHCGQHRSARYMEDHCGPYLEVASEYLAQAQYKNVSTIRSSLGAFLLYLTDAGSPDLATVNPARISAYLVWADKQAYRNARHSISVVKVFFDWLSTLGRHAGPNPVVASFHSERRAHHLPRPYSAKEMEAIWSHAVERGDEQVRAVLALGEATGLRIGDLCNLRLADVDLRSQRVFVRLPNKCATERYAPFTDKAAAFLGEWLAVSKTPAGHDHIFYNSVGRPFQPESLHRTLARVFCKACDGKIIHQDGLDSWSTHRLRHTMASELRSGGAAPQTILAVGGWKSQAVMLGYAKADEGRIRLDYEASMERASRKEATGLGITVLTDEEFLATF